jgi:mono/diheme cytochrome c family protein
MKTKVMVLTGMAAALLASCRGQVSKDPPIHIIGDMDWQQKYESQEESKFFADGRTNRPLPAGVVARGFLKDDVRLWEGRTESGEFLKVVPLEVDEKVLARGENRFNVFCAPCHDRSGSGKGLVIATLKNPNRFPVPPPDFASDKVLKMPDGEMFNVISHGVRGNMPSYKKQISPEDRWAVVAWVRVLQRSQHATMEDVPSEKHQSIEAESGTP